MNDQAFTVDAILEVLFGCVRQVNGQLPAADRLALTPDAVLVGEGGALDSLALINLLVSVEEELSGRFGTSVSLVDIVADDQHADAFATIGGLAAWLVQQQLDP